MPTTMDDGCVVPVQPWATDPCSTVARTTEVTSSAGSSEEEYHWPRRWT